MKTIKYMAYAITLLMACLMFNACRDIVEATPGDDFSSDGAPTIAKVTTPSNFTTEVAAGNMGDWLTIHGDNLAHVTAILFNDVEVDLKEIFAVRQRINVAIPVVAPRDKTNTLTVRTALGETSVPFTVYIPEIQVDGLENEFALPGSQAIITGKFFDLYGLTGEEAVITLGETPLTVVEKTDTRLVLALPEDAQDGAVITLNSPNLEQPIKLTYRDRGVPLFQSYSHSYLFDGGYLWTDRNYVTDGTAEDDPTSPIGGSFFRRKNVYGAWNWDTLLAGHFDLDDADVANNPENYDLKFEVWTNKTHPLSTGDFIFWGNQSDDKMKLRWNPAQGGVSFNTYGEWRTITLNARTFFQSNDGENTLKVGSNDLTIVYQPQNGIDADFAFVNFRFVKKATQ